MVCDEIMLVEDFNDVMQQKFDRTVEVASVFIAQAISKKLDELIQMPTNNIDDCIEFQLAHIVPRYLGVEAIFDFQFMYAFQKENHEETSPKRILFDAIWDAVSAQFPGWDVQYSYITHVRYGYVIMISHFQPQKMISVQDFHAQWMAEREKMIQFFKDAIAEAVNRMSGKASMNSCEINVFDIIYESDVTMTPVEGDNAYVELRDEFKEFGWNVQIHCRKESLKNILYPNREYSITIKPL